MTQQFNEVELHGKEKHHAADEKKHISQSQREIQALAKLFRMTNGNISSQESTWKKQTGWADLVLAAQQPCDSLLTKGTMELQFPLAGVQWERNHVVAIDLSGNGLDGRIPTEIVHLRFLRTLKLRNNPKLKGTVPQEMYSMAHLRYCYLDGTGLGKNLPFHIAHSFQITHFHDNGAATVSFQTGHKPQSQTHWVADMSEVEMFLVHTTLKARHVPPIKQQKSIEITAANATGPERAAAATKLQRIYRARIERTKIRKFLNSLFEKKVDPLSGHEYFIDTRTGESMWEKPALLTTPRQNDPSASGETRNSQRRNSQEESTAWQPFDDGYGNTYYWNSSTGESTWEPPAFLSRIYQELRSRYGADKTDDERFELFFQDIDRDQTGEIDKDEFARMCGELGMAMSAKQIDHIFHELDKSGDGQLNRQEIIAWLTRNYT